MYTVLFLLMLNLSVSDVFSDYMLKKFKFHIPKEKSIFLVMKEENCKRCYLESLNLAKNKIKQKNFYVIYCYKNSISYDIDFLKNKKNIFWDSTSSFFRLQVSPYSDALIYTSKSKVDSVVNLQ